MNQLRLTSGRRWCIGLSPLLELPGALPRSAAQQLAPPAVVIRNPTPKLPVEPTVVVPPDIVLPHTAPLPIRSRPFSGQPPMGRDPEAGLEAAAVVELVLDEDREWGRAWGEGLGAVCTVSAAA